MPQLSHTFIDKEKIAKIIIHIKNNKYKQKFILEEAFMEINLLSKNIQKQAQKYIHMDTCSQGFGQLLVMLSISLKII